MHSEAWSISNPAPAATIDELHASGSVTYERGWLVRSFRETESGVAVAAESFDGKMQKFHARHLILVAGALNSSRVVLASAGDYDSRLPLLDNLMTVLPVLHPAFRSSLPPA